MTVNKIRNFKQVFKSKLIDYVMGLKYAERIAAYYLLNNPYVDGILINDGVHKIIFPPDVKGLLPYALKTGNYQKTDLQNAISFLTTRSIIRGSTFMDIGANIGTSTIYAMSDKFFESAISIEPSSKLFWYLIKNLEINNLNGNVQTFSIALSNVSGTVELEYNQENPGDNRLAKISDFNALEESDLKSRSQSKESVASLTFDEFIVNNNIDIDSLGLVWIDVQGSEGLIFSHAEILKRSSVPIYCEFCPYLLKENNCLENFMNYASDGYDMFVYSQRDKSFQKTDFDYLISKYDVPPRADGKLSQTDILLIK